MMQTVNIVNIGELLPHRPPFIMVDRLTACQGYFASTEMFITEDNIFCRNGFFSEAGMMENMAQTCAARLGYKSLAGGMPVKLGIIGAVRDFYVFFLPVPGDKLVTEIQIEHEVFNAILLSARILCNGKTAATSYMKLFLTDIDSQPHEEQQ
ncbi:MAG TPA: pseudouridylate synthase [Bacteroidales bacterium]|nr:MAG: 3-hydroxyacyl-(acyl-carrier-protein) dehydratase FabZ [Bacteroidetes bacterium ADurb.Bin139]HOG24905.1 pseudouridylate synthase [Bacteroidales bacterium]HOR10703.1 pseudouridylate synthase [Bacteroidales bacterium]HPJ82805.1 pseudouridylate synthase [Bacteroidales bacterium]HPK39458.1 pseudouridylate synthase [Bacteroidales bacterium]